MANLEIVYRRDRIDGDVVAKQEIESPADVPSVDETITLPGRDGEKQFVVTARFAPTTTLAEGEAVRSAYTLLVKDPR